MRDGSSFSRQLGRFSRGYSDVFPTTRMKPAMVRFIFFEYPVLVF